jgi:type III secretory pathway component EscU
MRNVFGTQSLFGLIKSAFLVSNVTAFIFNLCVAGKKDAVCTYSFCAGNCKVIVQQWATYENSNCK